MALEDLTGTKYIDSLNSSNPTATDSKSEGDDHIRGIKNVLKTTFPGVSGAVTATHTELNRLDGGFPTVQNNLQIYAGYVDSGATAEVVPSGWSVAWNASGLTDYTVTHNLGLSNPEEELIVSVTPVVLNVSGTTIGHSANSFRIQIYDTTPAKAQGAFHFMAIKIA